MGKHYVSSGEEFIVDDSLDYLIEGCRWQLLRGKTPNCTTYVRGKENKTKKVYLLHRLLIGAFPGEQVDHINGNGMDNRLANLRIATPSQNQWNRKARADARSLKGISRIAYSKKRPWQARVTISGKRKFLGTFITQEEAVSAYNKAVMDAHGEFAFLI